MIADILIPTYDPPPMVNTVMMAVAGWLFGKQIAGRAIPPAENRERDKR